MEERRGRQSRRFSSTVESHWGVGRPPARIWQRRQGEGLGEGPGEAVGPALELACGAWRGAVGGVGGGAGGSLRRGPRDVPRRRRSPPSSSTGSPPPPVSKGIRWTEEKERGWGWGWGCGLPAGEPKPHLCGDRPAIGHGRAAAGLDADRGHQAEGRSARRRKSNATGFLRRAGI